MLSSTRIVLLFAWLLTAIGIGISNFYLLQSENHTKFSSGGSCNGRWVYVYSLPEVYNQRFLHDCATFKKGRNLCMYMQNKGLGLGFAFGTERGGSDEEGYPWFNTWQFSLEVYFHERLVREYPCLTDREERANAFYVPFYAGMDLSHRFTHRLGRGELYLELAKWMQRRVSWKRRSGRDHFIALGRIASDFRREGGGENSWGNEMLRQEAFKEMTVLSIERSSAEFREKEIAIPYPTYFHSNGDLHNLLAWVRQRSQRVSLVTMAAGQRQAIRNKMRHHLMEQCGNDPRCSLLLCVGHEASPGLAAQIRNVSLLVKMDGKTQEVSCNNPPLLLSALHQSVFCLQPPGDSPTRRSFFDAMLAGCIPVIFHKDAAWSQYVHHLPEQGGSFSVFIPMSVASKSNVIDILSRVDELKVKEMQANIAKLVPRILYNSFLEAGHETTTRLSNPDAFDIAMETLLGRINSQTRNESSSWR